MPEDEDEPTDYGMDWKYLKKVITETKRMSRFPNKL